MMWTVGYYALCGCQNHWNFSTFAWTQRILLIWLNSRRVVTTIWITKAKRIVHLSNRCWQYPIVSQSFCSLHIFEQRTHFKCSLPRIIQIELSRLMTDESSPSDWMEYRKKEKLKKTSEFEWESKSEWNQKPKNQQSTKFKQIVFSNLSSILKLRWNRSITWFVQLFFFIIHKWCCRYSGFGFDFSTSHSNLILLKQLKNSISTHFPSSHAIVIGNFPIFFILPSRIEKYLP